MKAAAGRTAIACPPLAGTAAGLALALCAVLDRARAPARAGERVVVVPARPEDAGVLRAILPPGVAVGPAPGARAARVDPGEGGAAPRTWHLRHHLATGGGEAWAG